MNNTNNIFCDAVILTQEKTKEEVIASLSKHLFKKGYVNTDYLAATLKREKDYPTGLSTQPIGIAVPHSNPENVFKESIVVAISKNLIKFSEMGNNNSVINVGIIFLLALKGENYHLNYLKDIVNYFKIQNNVSNFHALNSEQAIKSIFINDVLKV